MRLQIYAQLVNTKVYIHCIAIAAKNLKPFVFSESQPQSIMWNKRMSYYIYIHGRFYCKSPKRGNVLPVTALYFFRRELDDSSKKTLQGNSQITTIPLGPRNMLLLHTFFNILLQ